MRKKILILDDDQKVLNILAFALGREGYQVIKANNGLDDVPLTGEHTPDLIVLNASSTPQNDVPDLDSIEVCYRLREEGVSAPILVLIRAEEEKDEFISASASDFIIKPFAMRELLGKVLTNTWHINATSISGAESTKQIVLGRIVILPEQAIALKDGEPLDLTRREFDLLLFLAKKPGRVFSREELLRDVWDYTSFLGDPRNVDVSIRRLREKIEDDPGSPTIIVTRRGRGYFLALDAQFTLEE